MSFSVPKNSLNGICNSKGEINNDLLLSKTFFLSANVQWSISPFGNFTSILGTNSFLLANIIAIDFNEYKLYASSIFSVFMHSKSMRIIFQNSLNRKKFIFSIIMSMSSEDLFLPKSIDTYPETTAYFILFVHQSNNLMYFKSLGSFNISLNKNLLGKSLSCSLISFFNCSLLNVSINSL